MLSTDLIAHIATLAEHDVTINIYATSKSFSFLKDTIEDKRSERSFLIGSIIRESLAMGDGQSPTEMKKILMHYTLADLNKVHAAIT
jgi:FKBP-type peptidyl-prolyl cis-trans isomerase